MCPRNVIVLTAIALALKACAAEERPAFDWDGIGMEFCRHAVAENLAALGPSLTPSLRARITDASARTAVPPRLLLQSYDAPATGCAARTRNAGIVEIRREAPGQGAWTDLLVVVPEPDGSTRIDDILFATRSTDTLRERLRRVSGAAPAR